ncbi:MAG: PAS domain S-box protein [Planctomyces sp.]|nr:PAS domain S-box protein [Planctomyces sp.]
MTQQPKTDIGLGRAPMRIAGWYAVFGLLWIWLSDSALKSLGFEPDHVFLAGAIKGTAFVALTAALLYWLVRREVAVAERSESLLRAVVEGTTDAVFVKDKDGRYLLINEAAARSIGSTIADVLGRNDIELLNAEDAGRIISNDRAIMAGGKVVTLEETITSSGSKRTYQATKAPLHDTTGAVSGLIGVARDITERKAIEDALRDSEERYRELANAIPQIVWTAASDGAITHLNSKAVEYTGLEASDLTGWLWERVIHHDDLANAVSEWTLALGDGVPRTFEMRICRADGQYRWHIVRQSPIRDSAGKIQSWVGTCTDIDDLTQAENALRETDARLREAQRIARLGSWSWEPTTDKVWWSDAEFELFGVDRDAVQPGLGTFLALLHPDDRAIAIERVQSMKAGADEFANDLRIVRPDGECIWIHSRARATRDADANLIRVEGTDQNVSEIVRAKQELRAERDRFEKLMEAVPVAICSFHLAPNGHISMPYASHRIEAIYGIPSSTLATDASGIFSFMHPHDVERVRTGIISSSQTMTMWYDEFRVRSPVLGDIWVEGCSAPIRLSDGSTLWHGYVNDVTSRKQVLEALRASERRLRLALEAAGSIAFTWDITNDAVTRYFSNEPALPITGEHLGTLDDVRAKVHPDDLQGFDSRLLVCLAEGVDYRNTYRIVQPDGTTTNLEEYGYLDRAADGAPLSLTGISIDVTEREAATEALRVSEARYRQLVDLLPTAIFVYANDSILYGNPAFLRMIGARGLDELLGSSPFDIAHPSAHAAIHRRNELMTQTGEPVPGFEKRIVRRDGRSVPVYSVAAPISGYGPHATLVAVTDLTERERATELLRSVLSSVGDAIITMDERGVIGSANPAAERQFGYTETELIGQNANLLMPEPFGGKQTEREVECRRRDGSHFPAELTLTEFLLDGERRFTGVLRDITERKRLQTQFTQAQKMEAVGRLAGGVAHDFNNLLTIISGYCDLLMLSDLPAGDKRRESIATIRDAGERAARLTQQLLAFSRKAVIEPKLLDLNQLVSDATRLLRRLIGEDIIMAVVTAPKPIHVNADPGQLEQVIMNLVVNARDAMPTGGRLLIEASTVSQPDNPSSRFARLSVSDTGHGMSDEIKSKIFEPFFTTKGIGKGTGLGLAVVHGVVNQSGGQIMIESTVGVGTTFQILLPLVTNATSAEAVDKVRLAIRGSETVLLVEDDEAVRKITRISLQSQGYNVLEADGGAAALKYAENYPDEIHLLVSDVVMPEMGGRQLLDAVRRFRPGLRVLFISGYTDDAVLLHGVVEASDAFIQKPFTPLSLARKVREVIDTPAP